MGQVRNREVLQCMDTGSSEKTGGEDEEGEALSVRELPGCMEVLYGMGSRLGELLWGRVTGETREGHMLVGNKYLESGEVEDRVLLKQFEEGRFNDPTPPLGTLIALTSWEGETAGCKQSQRFLQVPGASFLAQLPCVPT